MSINPVSPATLTTPSVTAARPGAGGFKAALESAVAEVEHAKTAATDQVQKFLSGESEELHSAVLATQRAELEFDLFMQVRNKVVSAYQEIMRMQM